LPRPISGLGCYHRRQSLGFQGSDIVGQDETLLHLKEANGELIWSIPNSRRYPRGNFRSGFFLVRRDKKR
jgi:hypothetical protein